MEVLQLYINQSLCLYYRVHSFFYKNTLFKSKVKLGLRSVRNRNIYHKSREMLFIRMMFNNGTQFVGFTSCSIKLKIIFSLGTLHLRQTRIYLNALHFLRFRFLISKTLHCLLQKLKYLPS